MPRLCGHCYVAEGIPEAHLNYDGSPLLRCSRCKLQYYKDRDAQRSHWKLHKRSCNMIAAGVDYEAYEMALDDLQRCYAMLKMNLQDPKGAELPIILRKIRTLMDDGADDTGDLALEFHTHSRGLIFYGPNVMLGAMARPGMVELMLGSGSGSKSQGNAETETSFSEDLLSKRARILKKLDKYNGRPTEEFVRDFIPNEDERKRVEDLCEQFDDLDEWGESSSMSYCYLYYNLLVATAIRGQTSTCSVHDGRGTIRGSNGPDNGAEYLLATAALRRALSLWSDPYVLDSCGDAMAPAASLALTALAHYNERGNLGEINCREHEIVPGLTVDGALKTSLKELGQKAGSSQYSVQLVKLLGELALKDNSFWKSDMQPLWGDLTVDRRASCALAIVGFIVDNRGADAAMSSRSPFCRNDDPPPLQECNVLFRTVCGMCNPTNVELVKCVLAKASDEGEFLCPEASGHNATVCAFIYFLVRKARYEVEDIVKEIEEFDDIPRLHRAKNDDKEAKEKDECLKLAYGERMHAELAAIFNKR